MDGAYYAFYQELVRAAELLGPRCAGDMAALRGRAQDAGYGGARPSDDQIDMDLRSVRRALEEHKEELS